MVRGGFRGPLHAAAVVGALALAGCSLLLDFEGASDAAVGDAGQVDGTAPASCDVGEPDNGFGMAKALTDEVEAAICPPGDSDFYSFSVPDGAGVTIDLRFSFDDGGDIDLKLYDMDEALQTLATGTGDSERIEKRPELGNTLPAGDYFIEVYSVANEQNQYTLSIELDVPPAPDAGMADAG